jgi:hypothetical protein
VNISHLLLENTDKGAIMKIKKLIFQIIITALFTSQAGPGYAKETSAQIFDRISKTMSSVALDTPISKVKIPLRAVKDSECKDNGFCSYVDAKAVEYLFVEDNLAVLEINVAKWGTNTLPALGLGQLRKKPDVMKAARKFLGQTPFDCNESSLRPDDLFCKATIGDGWLVLEFNASGTLIRIQLEGWEYT